MPKKVEIKDYTNIVARYGSPYDDQFCNYLLQKYELDIQNDLLHEKLDDAALWWTSITASSVNSATAAESRQRFQKISKIATELFELVDRLGGEHRLELYKNGFCDLSDFTYQTKYLAEVAKTISPKGKKGNKTHEARQITFATLSNILKDHGGKKSHIVQFIYDAIEPLHIFPEGLESDTKRKRIRDTLRKIKKSGD